MKLSRLYCNHPRLFGPIDFVDGLNAVQAEIKDPRNRAVDTHNLGKTTLGRLLDFCLLRRSSKDFFLNQHRADFLKFTFFLEVQRGTGLFLTLRRSVGEDSKISFKLHPKGGQDFSRVIDDEWDHVNVPFAKSRELLDGFLDFSVLHPWNYRDILGYLLRVQDDYQDVFRLDKYRGRDKDWKPPVAHILGLDSRIVRQGYQLEDELTEAQRQVEFLRKELVGLADEPDKLEGLIAVKEDEIQSAQRKIDGFSFIEAERQINRELVDELELQVSQLNEERYYIGLDIKKVQSSIDDPVSLDPKEVTELFEEAGAALGDRLVRDLADLVKFHKSLTKERKRYLVKELKALQERAGAVEVQLQERDEARRAALSILKSEATMDKFRQLSKWLVNARTDLETLRRQRENMHKLRTAEAVVRELKRRIEEVSDRLIDNIESKPERYQVIRAEFSRIVRKVIGRAAVLSSNVNDEGHLAFSAEFVTPKGDATSEDEGHSYRKLLCIALDLAIVRAYLDESFPLFVFHDGVFEGLDDRKKLNLLEVMRDLARVGIQQIITLIDSDLPLSEDDNGTRIKMKRSEVILKLNDLGDEGRLFRMPGW